MPWLWCGSEFLSTARVPFLRRPSHWCEIVPWCCFSPLAFSARLSTISSFARPGLGNECVRISCFRAVEGFFTLISWTSPPISSPPDQTLAPAVGRACPNSALILEGFSTSTSGLRCDHATPESRVTKRFTRSPGRPLARNPVKKRPCRSGGGCVDLPALQQVGLSG